jgi:four helix bundle protein
MAEGFSRRTHRDQANFFATALASLNEVEDELGEAVDNEYVTAEEIASALNLKKRAYVAASRFRNSIKDRPDPPWNRWPNRRPKRTQRP